MRPFARLSIALIAVLLAACTGGAASPSAVPTPPPSPSVPSPSSPSSPSPDAQAYWLRVTTTQAIPPQNLFAVPPLLVITGDGVAVTQGPVMAIYPGPLMPNLLGRTISAAGRAKITQAAGDLGLLDGKTDFTGGPAMPGGALGHIELTVDGRRVNLTGNPAAQIVCVTTPCNPSPGTPEAFGELWRQLVDLQRWMGSELGAEAPYVATSYALLVGPAPQPEASLPQAPADWPLAAPLALFGGPVMDGTLRCGTVSGPDAATLRPALAAANTLTQWVQDPGTSATLGLTVRPMVPGEDVCREIFGPA